ncbi:MAG: GTP-binding protein, partial [Clostridia bacterium]|nr:GTP-binding protein [Clostridia bacterium]
MTEKQKRTRNFSIIAHIDHGKSTLADRILEATQTVAARDMETQLLDNMDLERERGMTIKARAVRLTYKTADGDYHLNLIDTPGHVDFGYEVSRSLSACEGALLVVDATQGVEAQTLANAYLAIDNDLEIVPVINKIDLPSADIENCRKEIEDIIGLPAEDCPAVSAKTGQNIEDVLRKIVTDIPAPKGDVNAPLKCLIFDSYYDSYLGVVVNVRVMDGSLRAGEKIRLMSTGSVFEVTEVGTLEPFGLQKCEELTAGDVGYITASIKTVSETRVGDTVTTVENGATEPLPGFRQANPMVYAGIYTP